MTETSKLCKIELFFGPLKRLTNAQMLTKVFISQPLLALVLTQMFAWRLTATYQYKLTHSLYCKKTQSSNNNIHVNSQCQTRLNCTKKDNVLQMQTTAWSYMGLRTKTINDMHIQYLYYIHTHAHVWISFTTTENSKLYNISAIRTVAQNTILIYRNTFFLLQCTSSNCPHKKMQSTSPKRPQKCMLSGQLGATGRKG